MKERIEELAEQAGLEFDDDSALEHEPIYYISQKDLEKFAELIVRECADIAKHHVMNISTYADADFVEKQIREHFGVEE